MQILEHLQKALLAADNFENSSDAAEIYQVSAEFILYYLPSISLCK